MNISTSIGHGVSDSLYSLRKMYEEMNKILDESRTPFHRVGPYLKGKKKILRGMAYAPAIKHHKGRTFAIHHDRAYQIIGGTYYRCHVEGNKIYHVE